MTKSIWCILVPTVKPDSMIKGKNKYFSLRYHKLWDKKVLDIVDGLTINNITLNGYWLSDDKKLYTEKCIQVYIICSDEDINKIADITALHYNQKAILFYLISNQVYIKTYQVKEQKGYV